MAKNIDSIDEFNNDPNAATIRKYISEWLKNNPNGETSALQAAISKEFNVLIDVSLLESLMIEEFNNVPNAATIRKCISEWLKNNPNGETSALQAAIGEEFDVSINLSLLESLMNDDGDGDGDLTPKKPSGPKR